MTDKSTSHTHAKAAHDAPKRDTDVAKHPAGKHIEGEHITQHKPDLAQGLAASGPNAKMEDVGKGSITEEAPAVRSTISKPDRVVQQGDEVIVHGKAIIDGQTEMRGLVLKVNDDSSIAVRVQRTTGQTFDVPGTVHNADLGDGSFYWSWPPDGDQIKRDKSRAAA